MSQNQLIDLNQLIERQRALTKSATILSDIENLSGHVHRVIDVIGPFSDSDQIYVYRFYEDDESYGVVSSWFADSLPNCELAEKPIFRSYFPKDVYTKLASGEAITIPTMQRRGYLLPVLNAENVKSALIYPLSGLGELFGMVIFISFNDSNYDVLCREWLDSIAAMLNSSLKRTISNELLSRQLKFRDALYPIIAHDLRSSVGSMQMITKAINNQQMGQDDKTEMLLWLEKISDETFMLLDNLLKWSRNNMQVVKPIKTVIEMELLVDGAVSSMAAVANAKKISIETKIENNLGQISCDSEMIKTILRNLISNAIKFSNPNTTVTVNGSQEDGKIHINVSDQGVGISTENLEKLNDNNVQFSSYGTQGEKGIGLGLKLIKNFIKLHNGTLNISSRIGKGSYFEVILPIG